MKITDPNNQVYFNNLSSKEFINYTNYTSFNINDMIDSFSHFSYDASEELFMIIDS